MYIYFISEVSAQCTKSRKPYSKVQNFMNHISAHQVFYKHVTSIVTWYTNII